MKSYETFSTHQGSCITAIVLDDSGSMSYSDLQPSRRAAARKATKRLLEYKHEYAPHDQVSIIAFACTAAVVCSFASPAQLLDKLQQCWPEVDVGGSTSMQHGLKLAEQKLKAVAVPTTHPGIVPLGHTVKASTPHHQIIMLSDGYASEIKTIPIADRLKQSGVWIDTIGIGKRDDVDETLLKAIASTKPDGTPSYAFIDDTQQLVQTFERLATHLKPLSKS